MTMKEAIRRADELRPNAFPEERKAAWLYELEGRLAETRHAPPPARTWPKDSVLSTPPPDDVIYELYLCAMIDWANQETGLYANDMAVFNAAWYEATARWRREHCPGRRQAWRVM